MNHMTKVLHRLGITPKGETPLPSYQKNTARPTSTDLADVREYVEQVLLFYGLNDWKLVYDDAKRRLGVCRYAKKQIGLSRHLLNLNGVEDIRNTVLHEVAHALVGPGHGHDGVWSRVTRQLGSDGKRLAGEVEVVKGRWQATCPDYQVVAHRHRQPKKLDGWYCRKCGRLKGKLVWVDFAPNGSGWRANSVPCVPVTAARQNDSSMTVRQ